MAKGTRVHRDWDKIIERLNKSKSKSTKIEMGSPGSAQVTRVRLLSLYDGLKISTEGNKLLIAIG